MGPTYIIPFLREQQGHTVDIKIVTIRESTAVFGVRAALRCRMAIAALLLMPLTSHTQLRCTARRRGPAPLLIDTGCGGNVQIVSQHCPDSNLLPPTSNL